MNQDITMYDYIVQHCTESMNNALAAVRYTTWERNCPEFTDIEFVSKGVLRCISPVDSGRHFIQNIQEQDKLSFPHSTYFTALHSTRRREMLRSVAAESYRIVCNLAEESEIDYLSHFPELDTYDIEAADGHFITHACHTPRNKKDKVFAAGFIYAMNLRNGFLNPICKVTNGTKRSHEIPCFRDWIETEYAKKSSRRKKIYIYDRAAVDYQWWNRQKKNDVFVISLLKENAVIKFVETLDFDKTDPVNAGVVNYELYTKNSGTFTVVTYKDPETDKVYKFVSTLSHSFRPGVIALLYYKRWTIEKAFNNTKSDLKEKKAWSSENTPMDIQMRLTAMTYNLMRLFEEKSKKYNSDLRICLKSFYGLVIFYIMEYKNDFYQLLILWKYFMRASYPSDISRTQFEIIRPMLEGARKKTKPRKLDLYDVFCGILYVVKTGCQWRMLPKDYPKWSSVYAYFKIWKSGNESGESIFDAALKKAGWQRED